MADGDSAEQKKLLTEALTEALSGELGPLAAEADQTEELLFAKVEDDADEILAGAADAWERWAAAKGERDAVRAALPRSRIGKASRRLLLASRGEDAGTALALGGLLVGLALGLAMFVAGRTVSTLALVEALGIATVVPTTMSLLVRLVAFIPVRPSESELRVSATEAVGSERKYRMQLMAAVSAWVRSRINVAEGLTYGTELHFKDASGLAEVDDPAHEISTKAKDELLSLVGRMPGGAIGLAGTRGAGKSTLMRSICVGRDSEGALGVVVDAPVQYDAREFILHLFAKLCGAVIGPERAGALRAWQRPFDLVVTGPEGKLGYNPIIGPVIGLAGLWLLLSALEIEVLGISWTLIIGALLLLAGYGLTFNSVIRDGDRVRGMLGIARRSLAARDDGDGEDMTSVAEQRLRQIWFQQSFSSGWSGALKVPVGLEGGISAGAELSEQQLSLPDIVDLLREFLELVSGERQVRIGIDELDKMLEEDAQQFLNEIKAIFRVPKCFFFVSISEDAMSTFERRGLPIRDVFDSSFDAVQYVPHLRSEQSRALLDRRIVDLPVSFAALAHCMSSGLPRDLIRTARDLVALDEGTPLDDAARALMARALAAKATATKVQARRLAFGGHVTMLVRWLESLSAAECEPEILLDICRGSELRFREELSVLPSPGYLHEEEAQLQDMAIQLVVFAYYAATLLQVFEGMGDPESIDAALEPQTELDEPLAPVDRLAAASQEFAVDLNGAWEMLSRLRSDLQLEAIAFPRLYMDDPDAVSA